IKQLYEEFVCIITVLRSETEIRHVTKEILHGVSGEFKAGELTAIMGPSGAGKSTLLNILAGYKIRGSEGSVLVNGKDNSKSRTRLSCYIMQDDALRPKLTLLDLLEMLGLREHCNTQAGSLSGGQKKRLSIALELISNPPIIYLDEPTTGLDSSSCSQCVSLLKFLAQQGRTVVCTIHQPTALLFEMFDHLYSLAEGNCIYQGSIKSLLPFLRDLGLNCPTYHNPADFLIEVAIGEYGADVNKLNPSIFHFIVWITHYTFSTYHSMDELNASSKQASILMQCFLLIYRSILVLSRSYKSILIRLLSHLVIGVIFGYLYQGVGHYADTAFGNYVYLYGTALFLVYTSKMAVTLSIPLEMMTLKREYFNQWYRLLPSYLSVILMEIPVQIICSATYIVISHYLTEQSTEPHKIAVFLSPVIAVLFSTFGFNIFYKHIPEYFLWMYHISYFRAGFHSLMTIAFTGDQMPCRELYCHFKTPTKFLDELDIQDRNVFDNLLFIGCFGLVFHIITFSAIYIRLNRR
ncbi:ATP-binding cassette sub-family G member 4, partial [Blattella germanica]